MYLLIGFFDGFVEQMAVLNIMSLIIDKMSGSIEQNNADSLCQYLPMLWDESNDHNMLRCAILSTLVSIFSRQTHALGTRK